MTPLKQQDGFTLIELIAVIIILGILAATAIPKFTNISSDANIAVLKSMGGAIKTAEKLVYMQSAMQGLNNNILANVDLDSDGTPDIETRYGYPSGSRSNGLSKAMDDSFTREWIWSTDYRQTRFYLTMASFTWTSGEYVNQVPIVATDCYLIYSRAASLGESPDIEYITSGC